MKILEAWLILGGCMILACLIAALILKADEWLSDRDEELNLHIRHLKDANKKKPIGSGWGGLMEIEKPLTGERWERWMRLAQYQRDGMEWPMHEEERIA